MAENVVRQRLAAILAADVAGYSRLMGDDERATIDAINRCRAVFREHIEANGGRVVDMAGDSVLAIFDTAIGAFTTAIAAQERLADLNSDIPDDRRMLWRIGVNTGDIHEQDDGTVYGDGVNVAARLEALAEPGGICVSGKVRDELRGKIDRSFADLGEHEVKNIAEPVRAYRVLAEGEAAPAKPSRMRLLALAGAAVAVAAVAAVVLWPSPEPPPEVVATAEPEDPILTLPTGPSIAVLPFDNPGDDEDDDWFADGIAEDILTRLSRFTDLKVIARNSSFQYKGQSVDIREVGRELGADYVLEGSVRRTPDAIRVTVQLLDARDGAHIWAETYDRALTTESLFALQDEITTRIASAIGGNFGAVAAARIRELGTQLPDDLTSYECVLLGYQYQRVVDAAAHLAARTCLEQAIERDPDYVDGLAWLGQMYVEEVWSGFNPRTEGPSSLDAAFEVLGRAIGLDPGHQKSRHALALAYFLNRDYEQFRVESKRAIDLNPNNIETLSEMAWMIGFGGEWDRAMVLFAKIEALGDVPPWLYILPYNYHYRNHDYAQALVSARQFAEMGHWGYQLYTVFAQAQLGNAEETRAAMAVARAMEPALTEEMIREAYGSLFAEESHISHLMEGYEKTLAFEAEAAPTRPVIAVLPFDNMSGDPEQEYFADGITEDIITRLSRFQALSVIARTSTFQFKGQANDVRKIGEDLNASHIVEGSVRKSSGRIRVTVQLIDASDGNHLWSETYDRDLSASDIFDIQDDITARVASTIGDNQGIISRSDSESAGRRQTDNLSSYECSLRWYEYSRLITPESHTVAQDCLQRTVRIDPDYVEAWAYLSEAYGDAYANDFATVEDPLAKALAASENALVLDPTNQQAAHSLAYVYFLMRDKERYVTKALEAYALNPNNAFLAGSAGWGLMFADEWEQGFSMMQSAMELNPYHPGWWHFPILIYEYINEDYDAALAEAEKLKLPDYFWTHAMFAVVYAKLGRDADANDAVARALELHPDFGNRPRFYVGAYVFSDDVVEQIMDGLRLAGMEVPDKPAEQQ